MGCASSKLFTKDLRREIVFGNGDCTSHAVSLTSSTYGVLKLDKDQKQQAIREVVKETKTRSPPREEPEVINAWELMEDLEDEAPISVQAKKSPKSRGFFRGLADKDARSPLKFLNQMASPKKLKRFGGKENKGRSDCSPKRALKSSNLPENSRKASLNLRIPMKGSATDVKSDNPKIDSGVPSPRRSLEPLLYPELVASFEKELSEVEEKEQIKKMVSATPRNSEARNSGHSVSILDLFDKKCPPAGENAVVIYTTTLRGIRKTFEDCNNVRSIIESHQVQTFERDVSMDSGFKEELRGLMGTKEVKVPVVFVKGRLIGGADEVVELEEEGKLGTLFDRIPRVVATATACGGCAGIRFVLCVDCNGSCKVVGKDGKKIERCGECNENGLTQCPICC